MGYGCLNITMYQTISSKIRPKIDQANRNNKYDHSKWPEEPNLRNSEKCSIKNNRRFSIYQYLYHRLDKRRTLDRIKLVLKV